MDSTVNWPVYSFIMRNIGSICSQYVRFAKAEDTRNQNENLLRRIRELERTAEFCDYKNKLTFHCICTEMANKRCGIDKHIGVQLKAEETAFPENMFSPIVIIACQDEMQLVTSVLNFGDRFQKVFIIVFLKEDNEMPKVSSTSRLNTLLLTLATGEEIFTQIDKIVMEKLVFRSALLPMFEYLSAFLQRFEFKGE